MWFLLTRRQHARHTPTRLPGTGPGVFLGGQIWAKMDGGLLGERRRICVNFVSVATGKPLQASLVTHLLTS